MSGSDWALERCLRLLIKQSKMYGGCITYQIVIDTLHDTQCEVTMEALDLIYDRLATEGIEIVDRLPDMPATTVDEYVDQEGKESKWKYRKRTEVVKRKQGYQHGYDFTETLSGTGAGLCPEEAIDKLFLRAETGLLSGRIFLNIVKKYRLSKNEVEELVEYLGSKGVDISDFNLSQFYKSITDNIETHVEGEKESLLFLDDPFLRYYLKYYIDKS